MASRVTDVHGNWVRYNYDNDGRLTRIYSNDGRSIEINYASGSYLVSSVVANGRTWNYHYQSAAVNDPFRGEARNDKKVLSKVYLPDGTFWQFDLADMHKRPGIGRRCYSGTGRVSLTHPNGVTGEYVFHDTAHRIGLAQWETIVNTRCGGQQ